MLKILWIPIYAIVMGTVFSILHHFAQRTAKKDLEHQAKSRLRMVVHMIEREKGLK